jgi:hypothetical protein
MRVYSLGARSVAGDLAAVDVQDLAGNERRRLEDDDGVDDVADLARVPYRGEPRAEPGVVFRRMHRRLDDARRDGVDPDAAGGVFSGQRFDG